MNVEDQEDCALLVAATRGDHASWGTIYDRHAPSLLTLGLHFLPDQGEAEDVLHAVFLEAWKQAGAFDPGRGTVRTWLRVRMRSRCRDRLKSAGYARRARLEDHTEAAETSATNQPSFEQAVDAAKARDALRELPQELQTVLILGYFGGLSATEIAKQLQLPAGTVKSRVASGLARLRKRLQPPGNLRQATSAVDRSTRNDPATSQRLP